MTESWKIERIRGQVITMFELHLNLDNRILSCSLALPSSHVSDQGSLELATRLTCALNEIERERSKGESV